MGGLHESDSPEEKSRLDDNGKMARLRSRIAEANAAKESAERRAAESKQQLAEVRDDHKKIQKTLEKAEQKLEANEDERMCMICQERERTGTFLPCGHFILCEVCATDVKLSKRCPKCRANIK